MKKTIRFIGTKHTREGAQTQCERERGSGRDTSPESERQYCEGRDIVSREEKRMREKERERGKGEAERRPETEGRGVRKTIGNRERVPPIYGLCS